MAAARPAQSHEAGAARNAEVEVTRDDFLDKLRKPTKRKGRKAKKTRSASRKR